MTKMNVWRADLYAVGQWLLQTINDGTSSVIVNIPWGKCCGPLAEVHIPIWHQVIVKQDKISKGWNVNNLDILRWVN